MRLGDLMNKKRLIDSDQDAILNQIKDLEEQHKKLSPPPSTL